MGKKGSKRRGAKQHGMDLEVPAAGGGSGDWTTAPVAAAGDPGDFLGMDTSDAGKQQQGQQQGQQGQQQGQQGQQQLKPQGKRGMRSTRQKERKRKSFERALAVASRKETKVAKQGATSASKKSLKKLWTAAADS